MPSSRSARGVTLKTLDFPKKCQLLRSDDPRLVGHHHLTCCVPEGNHGVVCIKHGRKPNHSLHCLQATERQRSQGRGLGRQPDSTASMLGAPELAKSISCAAGVTPFMVVVTSFHSRPGYVLAKGATFWPAAALISSTVIPTLLPLTVQRRCHGGRAQEHAAALAGHTTRPGNGRSSPARPDHSSRHPHHRDEVQDSKRIFTYPG